MIQISVIICTHNREYYLQSAIESLKKQSLPSESFEVIIVNNASSDHTNSLVSLHQATMQNLKYIHEARLGLSFARNTGAEIAQGKYIVYLDDDAIAVDDWLSGIFDAFINSTLSPAAVGGPVQLNWEGGAPPEWLPRQYWSLYTHLDYGLVGRFITPEEYLVGANIGFNKKILLEIGGFDTRLGRKGLSLLSGEESSVLRILRDRSLPIYYQPKALVYHTVPRERQSKNWLLRRLFWDGASQPLLDRSLDHSRRFYFKQCLFDLRRMLRFSLDVILGNKTSIYSFFQRVGRLRTNLNLLLQPEQKDT